MLLAVIGFCFIFIAVFGMMLYVVVWVVGAAEASVERRFYHGDNHDDNRDD